MKSKSNKLSNNEELKLFYAHLSISFSPKHKHDPRSPPPTTGIEFLENIYPWYKLYVMYKIHLGLNQLILMDVI